MTTLNPMRERREHNSVRVYASGAVNQEVGKPQQNAFVESFNERLRDEVLNETLFSSLKHARELLAAWQDDYNTVRQYGGIGNLPPSTYARLKASDMQWGDRPQ